MNASDGFRQTHALRPSWFANERAPLHRIDTMNASANYSPYAYEFSD